MTARRGGPIKRGWALLALASLVLGLAVAAAPGARAGDGGGWDYAGGTPFCTDESPQCVEEAANSYLVAIRAHDGDFARLAPWVKRTRNAGEQTPETQWYTRDELADSLDESEDPVLSVHSIDWVVDGDTAVAFFAIDASYEERGEQAAQTWLAERFRIRDGLIHEIEAIFFFAPGRGTTNRGWTSTSSNGGQVASDRNGAWCTDAGRECLLSAASSYVDALVNGDSSRARLSDDVRRTLNGKETGRHRAVVQALALPSSAATYQLRNVRYFADTRTGDVVVFAALDQSLNPLSAAAGHVATIHLAQRLRVTTGLVHEIEQIAWPTPGTQPSPTGWETATAPPQD